MERKLLIENKWGKMILLSIVMMIVLIGIFNNPQNNNVSRQNSDIFSNVLTGDITLGDALILLLLGLLSGMVGGLLGMGGGVMKVANLHMIMGFEIVLARIVSLISYCVISFSAFLIYRKSDFILWNVVKMLIPSAILGSVVGVIIGSYINPDYIELLLGIYALFAGVVVLNHIWTSPAEETILASPEMKTKETTVSVIGIGMGIICGLLGISGGIFSTPMQQTFLKFPLKNSIANTVTAAIFCSITASGFILVTGLHKGDFILSEVMILTVILIPGNFFGGQIGGWLAKRLNINIMRVIFAIVAFAIGFSTLS